MEFLLCGVLKPLTIDLHNPAIGFYFIRVFSLSLVSQFWLNLLVLELFIGTVTLRIQGTDLKSSLLV